MGSEKTEDITEAHQVFKEWNADWHPSHFVVDFCEAEIGALEAEFPESAIIRRLQPPIRTDKIRSPLHVAEDSTAWDRQMCHPSCWRFRGIWQRTVKPWAPNMPGWSTALLPSPAPGYSATTVTSGYTYSALNTPRNPVAHIFASHGDVPSFLLEVKRNLAEKSEAVGTQYARLEHSIASKSGSWVQCDNCHQWLHTIFANAERAGASTHASPLRVGQYHRPGAPKAGIMTYALTGGQWIEVGWTHKKDRRQRRTKLRGQTTTVKRHIKGKYHKASKAARDVTVSPGYIPNIFPWTRDQVKSIKNIRARLLSIGKAKGGETGPRSKEEPARLYALYVPPRGRRRRGRQPTTYLQYIQRLLGDNSDLSPKRIADIAQDKTSWRELTVVCSAAAR
ncbi:hypothetical protein Bbelb_421220 [Branchiostoma belcheri]|nr:hypothetical protein Bbelb_421220 [Branchiostoma belcheri]